jgi:hypothetical protein
MNRPTIDAAKKYVVSSTGPGRLNAGSCAGFGKAVQQLKRESAGLSRP